MAAKKKVRFMIRPGSVKKLVSLKQVPILRSNLFKVKGKLGKTATHTRQEWRDGSYHPEDQTGKI